MSSGERRLFTVSAPDWGQTHLTSDAVVAFVDDELDQRPHARATQHVAACADCAAEVVAQRQARTALRGASCPSLPSSLLSSLRSIPQDAELPGPPAGLAVSTDGELVSVLRAEACPVSHEPEPEPGAVVHGRRPPAPRRMRFGAGVAVGGLAAGALALGVATIPDVPLPTSEPGVFGGSVLNPGGAVPARLGLDTAGAASDDARLGGVARTPRTFLRQGLR
ncbi:anti-sigma factor family protein [Pseudonocardia saturnea]